MRGRGVVFSGILFVLITIGLQAVDVHDDIISPAWHLKGAPYVYGNQGPQSFDCSGFIYYLYKPYVPSIPRSSRDYLHYGTAVEADNLLPGDLLLFATMGDSRRVSHVAVYIGQQSVIHAVSNGPETGVIVSRFDSGYWRRKFHSARRVLSPSAVNDQTSSAVRVDYERGRYTGPLVEGEPEGSGEMRLNNGDHYAGEFKDGLFHGTGTYTWSSGKRYTGEFEKGEIVKAPASPEDDETYLEKSDSPWDDWDGEVYGDYREWRKEEQSSFEAFKEREQSGTAGTLQR